MNLLILSANGELDKNSIKSQNFKLSDNSEFDTLIIGLQKKASSENK